MLTCGHLKFKQSQMVCKRTCKLECCLSQKKPLNNLPLLITIKYCLDFYAQVSTDRTRCYTNYWTVSWGYSKMYRFNKWKRGENKLKLVKQKYFESFDCIVHKFWHLTNELSAVEWSRYLMSRPRHNYFYFWKNISLYIHITNLSRYFLKQVTIIHLSHKIFHVSCEEMRQGIRDD